RLARVDGWRILFRFVSRLGDGMLWYALMAVLLAKDGMAAAPAVGRMALAGLIGLAIYKWLKTRTRRPPPGQVYSAIAAAAPALDRFSFPSGHTLHAVSFTTVACASYPELAIVLYPFTALVAISRPVLGLHYPTDVIAGALIGAAVAEACLLF